MIGIKRNIRNNIKRKSEQEIYTIVVVLWLSGLNLPIYPGELDTHIGKFDK